MPPPPSTTTVCAVSCGLLSTAVSQSVSQPGGPITAKTICTRNSAAATRTSQRPTRQRRPSRFGVTLVVVGSGISKKGVNHEIHETHEKKLLSYPFVSFVSFVVDQIPLLISVKTL